ncbi:MAG: hypothetical protein ACFFD4_31665 [Candidatus Odinarchaeota archaeon]
MSKGGIDGICFCTTKVISVFFDIMSPPLSFSGSCQSIPKLLYLPDLSYLTNRIDGINNYPVIAVLNIFLTIQLIFPRNPSTRA